MVDASDLTGRQFSSFANTLERAVMLRLTTPLGHTWYTYWGESAIGAAQLAQLAQTAREANGSAVWVTLPQPDSRLILARDIREVKWLSFDSLGTIYLEIDLAGLVDDQLKAMEALGCPLSVAIFDGGECLYATDETAGALRMDEDGYIIADTETGKMLCMRYTSAQGWAFLMARPYEPIFTEIRAAILRAIGRSLLAAFAALAVGALLIGAILKHLQVLLGKIDRFRQGELPEPREILPYRDRRDEMGRLHRHFDRMISDYDHIVRDNYEKQLAIKDAQARHLDAHLSGGDQECAIQLSRGGDCRRRRACAPVLRDRSADDHAGVLLQPRQPAHRRVPGVQFVVSDHVGQAAEHDAVLRRASVQPRVHVL